MSIAGPPGGRRFFDGLRTALPRQWLRGQSSNAFGQRELGRLRGDCLSSGRWSWDRLGGRRWHGDRFHGSRPRRCGRGRPRSDGLRLRFLDGQCVWSRAQVHRWYGRLSGARNPSRAEGADAGRFMPLSEREKCLDALKSTSIAEDELLLSKETDLALASAYRYRLGVKRALASSGAFE